jgi:hypothetical protein
VGWPRRRHEQREKREETKTTGARDTSVSRAPGMLLYKYVKLTSIQLRFFLMTGDTYPSYLIIGVLLELLKSCKNWLLTAVCSFIIFTSDVA